MGTLSQGLTMPRLTMQLYPCSANALDEGATAVMEMVAADVQTLLNTDENRGRAPRFDIIPGLREFSIYAGNSLIKLTRRIRYKPAPYKWNQATRERITVDIANRYLDGINAPLLPVTDGNRPRPADPAPVARGFADHIED